jgi:hypothetical protein
MAVAHVEEVGGEERRRAIANTTAMLAVPAAAMSARP